MAEWLRQSTAVTKKMGPFLDEDDGKTQETGLTIAQADIRLTKNGGAFAQTNNVAGGTHDEKAYYGVPLDATDTATLGSLKVAIHKSGALPVWQEFEVVPANVYDSYFSTDKLYVHAVEMSAGLITADVIATDAVDADALKADAAEEIADKVWDEVRSGHVAAGSFGQGVASVQGSVTGNVTGNVTGSVGSLAAQAKVDVNAEVDAALNTAIPGTPTADSLNERVKALDDNYTAARATKVDNLDATVSSRSNHTAAAAGTDAAGKVLVTPGNKLATDASGRVTVADIIAAALAKFFATDSGSTYAASVAGSVVKEIADNAGGGTETRLRTGTAQAGSSTTITLDAGASATNDHYKHCICAITGGTGAGQSQIVDSYVGATKVATLAASLAVALDNTSQFVLLPLGTIPGASAPSAAAVADTVLDELAKEKISVDRSTGDITAYKPDESTVRGTRRITEIDSDTQGLILQP